jgi:hypothetical protein
LVDLPAFFNLLVRLREYLNLIPEYNQGRFKKSVKNESELFTLRSHWLKLPAESDAGRVNSTGIFSCR